MQGKGRALVLIAAMAVASFIGAQVAIGYSTGDVVVANGGLHQTKVLRDNSGMGNSSGTWVDVDGMSVNVTAPTKSLIVVHFAAESWCQDAADEDWCSVRVRIGAKPGEPDEGTDHAFDNGSSRGDEYESHAIIRSRVVPAGTYTVKAQMNSGKTDNFYLDDIAMEVQVIDV